VDIIGTITYPTTKSNRKVREIKFYFNYKTTNGNIVDGVSKWEWSIPYSGEEYFFSDSEDAALEEAKGILFVKVKDPDTLSRDDNYCVGLNNSYEFVDTGDCKVNEHPNLAFSILREGNIGSIRADIDTTNYPGD